MRLFRVMIPSVVAPALLLHGGAPSANQPEDLGYEVQASGPIHEAFAHPIDFQPDAEALVPKAPPEPIPEEPPPQMPPGDNVEWIGGYWAWDADRGEFLWVSGAYRDRPPGRRFVAGYWEQVGEGWRWVPGFWAPEGQPELPYLPQPPATIDQGPSFPPPHDDAFYNPGCWVWRETRYVWRPGYWADGRLGMVWIRPHHHWTPCGHVFVDGYWDYPLERRGLLFASVAFNRPLWRQPGWVFRPRHLVHSDAMLASLFVRPRGGHYYHGDFYGPRFARHGFEPWATYGPRQRDPLYTYYRWENRRDRTWEASLQRTVADRAAGRAPLPPRTLAQQTALLADAGVGRGPAPQRVISALNEAPPDLRLRPAAPQQLAAQQSNAQRVREISQERARAERALVASAGPAPAARSAPPEGSLRLPGPNEPPRALTAGPRQSSGAPPAGPAVKSPGSGPQSPPKTMQPTPKGPAAGPGDVGRVLPEAPKGPTSNPTPRVDGPKGPVTQPRVEPPKGPGNSPARPKADGPSPQPLPKGIQPPQVERPTPKVIPPTPVPQPQPRTEQPRPAPQPKSVQPQQQPQPRTERPAPGPAPKVEPPRPQPQPQPQPRTEQPRPAPQPKSVQPQQQPPPRTERPTPVPQPKAVQPSPAPKAEVPRVQPQPQPRVEPPRPTPQPKANPAPQPPPVRIERPAAPPPAPRPQAQPQPKAAPAPAPRPQAAPAPRIQSPPPPAAPRPAPAPRPSGGGGAGPKRK